MTEYDLKLYLDNQFREIKDELKSIHETLNDHVQRITGVETEARYIKSDIDQIVLNKDRDHQRIWDNFQKCKVEEQEKSGIYSKNQLLSMKLWITGLTILVLFGMIAFLAKEFFTPLYHQDIKVGGTKR